jgi:hypothetical protein
MTVRAPMFALPRDIKNMDEARAFIADKFKVKPERVAKLGESYFTHVGVTPQRVFPFAVAGMGTWGKTWTGGTTICAPIRRIRRLLYWDFDETLMYMTQRAMLTMGNDSDFSFDRTHRQDMKKLLMEGAGMKTMALSDPGGFYSSDTGSGQTSGGGASGGTGGLNMTDALFTGETPEKPVENENRNTDAGAARKRKLNPK